AQDAPLEPGREGVLDLPLDGDRLAEARDQLAEAELDRVEAKLECPVLELVDGEALAVVEDVPVVERDRVVDLASEEHRPARRGLLPEDVAPAPVLRAKGEAAIARVR